MRKLKHLTVKFADESVEYTIKGIFSKSVLDIRTRLVVTVKPETKWMPNSDSALKLVPKCKILCQYDLLSIAEKCFDIWGILKMVSLKSVESGNNCFSINHIIRCRSKFLPLGFSNFVLFLIL